MINNSTIFNQPLFYLGSLLKKNLLKSEENESYFNKITIINDKTKDIYLEIEACNKQHNNKKKINYLLDRLKYTDEIVFMYDNAKLILKTEKICDKHAITIHRDEFALFSTFSITCEEEDFAKYESFINTSIKYFNKYYDEFQLGKDDIKLMLSSDEGGYFTSLGYRKKRNLDTIYLPSKQKQKMIDDLTYFLDEKTKAKYAKLGILHKRTYLFEGIPGSGKSSFIMALASHFGYNLAIISFTPKMHDNDLIRLLRSLDEKEENKVFIIFEDMDCIFKERKSNDESRNMITFSGILNALDGITTRDNMICFITTNYKQHLDSALIRPGRVDSIFRFDYVNKEQVIDIFTAFTERPDKAQLFYDELSRFNINISASLLQQYLLKYIDEPNIDKAIDNIDELKKMYDAAHVSKEAGETGLYN
jgi:predicted AAA+ superfamily ATPase